MKKRIVSLMMLILLLFGNTDAFGARRRSSSRSRSSSSASKSYSSGTSSWSTGRSSNGSSGSIFGGSNNSNSSSRSYSSGSNNSIFKSSYTGKKVENGATTSKKAYDTYNTTKSTTEGTSTGQTSSTSQGRDNTSSNTRNDQYYGNTGWGTTSRPLRDSFFYMSAMLPVSRSRIYTSGNRVNTKTVLTNDELLSLVTEIPSEDAIRYFVFNRKRAHIKNFVKELNQLDNIENKDEEFSKKVKILNERLREAYKADSRSNHKKTLIALLFGGLILVGCYKMKIENKEKKNRKTDEKNKKDKEINLPFGLEVGSYLEFNGLLFSNLGYDSKFFLNDNKNIIRSHGISKVGENDIINLYLDNEHEKNTYLQLHIEDNQVIESILFKNLDIIYPKDKEDWDSWIGQSGIVGEETFFIHDTGKDVVQDALYKFVKKIEPTYNRFSSVSVEFRDNILKTNIFDKITKGDAEKEQTFMSEYRKDTYLQKIITAIKKEDNGHSLTLDLYEADNYTEVEYENICGGKYERQEKVHDTKVSKTEALYSRSVDGEFFENEYILLSSTIEDERAYISIDVGVHIDLDLHKI